MDTRILTALQSFAAAACIFCTHIANAYIKQDPARVAQIAGFLSEAPAAPGAPISDRAAWGRLAATQEGGGAIKKAASLLKEPIQECPDELYLEFSTPGNGNRTHYEKPYFERLRSLQRLVLGECLENKGRFLPKIIEYIDAICAERSWTMPAHDKTLDAFYGRIFNVDLGASHRAEVCSWTISALKDVLPKSTYDKMRSELEKRIFEPVRRCCRAHGSKECLPMWWFQGIANWTAVCQSCVVRAALAVVEDRNSRAEFIEGAERSVSGFLGGFTDDGYCSEGLGYWNYGWGHFLELSLAVRTATGGKVNFCSSPKARAVMALGTGVLVEGCTAASIADGGGNLDNGVLQLGHLIWPDMPMTEPSRTRKPLSDSFARYTLLDFGQWESVPPAEATDYPVRTAFQFAQMFVLRPGESGMPFRLAVKAGHNGEFHNHNDVGTYALFMGDRQLSGDPGGTEYNAKTFSAKRYEIKIINSYGHPVPVLNGALQKPGRSFAGKVLTTEFTDDRDVITFDLLGAYGSEAAAESLVRTFTYDRKGSAVSVTDRVVFKDTGTFSVPVLTAGEMVASGAEGVYRISVPNGKKAKISAFVDIKVDGARWTIGKERIENPNRVSPNRYAITLAEPVRSATVTVAYRP